MDLTLSDEHIDLAAATRQLLDRPEAAVARLAEETPPEPARRRRLLEMLDEFGLGQLDIVASPSDLLSAALILEQCGSVAAAAPGVPLVLGRAAGGDGLLHAVAPKRELILNHLDLGLASRAIDLEGRLYEVEPHESDDRPARAVVPFASRAALRPTGEAIDPWLWSAGTTLIAFGALGQLGAALDLAVDHVSNRIQFGRPLAEFQSVRNRIADLVVARNGLRELCHHTLWRAHAKPAAALVDALLLRRFQVRTMRKAMLSAHQLHGAMGFCYEYPLVGLTLSAEYDRHVPLTESECLHELVQRFEQIDMHYDDELAPAWQLVRRDDVPVPQPAASEAA